MGQEEEGMRSVSNISNQCARKKIWQGKHHPSHECVGWKERGLSGNSTPSKDHPSDNYHEGNTFHQVWPITTKTVTAKHCNKVRSSKLQSNEIHQFQHMKLGNSLDFHWEFRSSGYNKVRDIYALSHTYTCKHTINHKIGQDNKE